MPPGHQPTERLARDFHFGDEEAYDYFFRLYFQALCLFARRILQHQSEPEDIVQECFIKLWHKRSRVTNPEAIKSFLYRTVQNACLDFLKSKQAQIKVVSISDDILTDNPFQNSEAAIVEAELLREIHQLVNGLPERIREVFQLYYLEGKSETEIGQLLHTSPHTVRNQRVRAIALLRQRIGSTSSV